MRKLPRVLFFLLGAAMFALGIGAISFGIRRGLLAVLPGAACIIAATIAGALKRKMPRAFKLASRTVAVVTLTVATAFVVASAQILTCYFDDTDVPQDAVVVVLGCGLSPVDQTSPSLMLTLRLRAAERYLRENPDALCVVTGGQGANERVPEARAMYDWLVRNGVEPSRILVEGKSVSTAENLAFAREIVRSQGIACENVVIVTDGFHEFRAHHIARGLGMTAYTASSRAPFGLTAFYWVREVAGVVIQVWL